MSFQLANLPTWKPDAMIFPPGIEHHGKEIREKARKK
jgi:hypothetical protein